MSPLYTSGAKTPTLYLDEMSFFHTMAKHLKSHGLKQQPLLLFGSGKHRARI